MDLNLAQLHRSIFLYTSVLGQLESHFGKIPLFLILSFLSNVPEKKLDCQY